MKMIENLTLAAIAATLLINTSTARASDHRGKSDEKNHGAATVSFTKWATKLYPLPSEIFADMAGFVEGGDIGDGEFSGELLSSARNADNVLIGEAVYHFDGSKHSFSAHVRLEQPGFGPGSIGVITGVITEGWLKGHRVEGVYLVVSSALSPCYAPGSGIGNCFEVDLYLIKRHAHD